MVFTDEVLFTMVKDKFKLYKFNIAVIVFCTIMIGLSYLQLRLQFLGIIFIITAICSAIVAICYFIEKRKT